MNKKIIGLAVLPLLLTIFYVNPTVIPMAHAPAAFTGIVCITDTSATQCPANPETLTPATPTQLSVAVFINGSDTFPGFDIALKADHTIIKPAGASTTGSILPSPTIVTECIGGVPKVGSSCPSYDTVDTLELVVSGSPTARPVTGLLFIATYNITGSTATTPIGFQTGCGTPQVPTSVPPLCISISSGGTTNQPETAQTGSFSNLPYYSMATTPASLTISKGGSDSSLLTLTSLNNFAGTVTLSTSVSPAGPTASVLDASRLLTPNGQNFTTISVNVPAATTPGTYDITTTGKATALPDNSVLLRVVVPSPDFSLTASPGAINMNATTSKNSTITVASIGAFAGPVNLSLSNSNPGNITATLTVTSITLGTSGTSTLKITSPSDHIDFGQYNLTITAQGGSITHTIIIGVTVVDFGMSASPTSLTMSQGTVSGLQTFVFSSLPQSNSFIGQITLTSSVSPTSGLAVSCSPLLINFTTSIQQGTHPNCNFSASVAGNYQVKLTGTCPGTCGPIVHSITISVTVKGADFSVAATKTQFQGVPGGTTVQNSTAVTVTSLANFGGTITLSASSNPNGPNLSISPVSVKVNSTTTTATAQLTITVTPSVPAGNYVITVSGTNGTLTHTVDIIMNITDYSITANPTSVGPLVPGASSQVTVTITRLNRFAGTVQLTAIPSTGLSTSLNPSTLIMNSTVLSGKLFATLTVSSAVLGTYTVMIIATKGPVSHNVNVTIIVNARPDLAIFSVTTSPTSVTIGQTVTFTIIVQNLVLIPENATVAALIGDQTVANSTILLPSGGNRTVTLIWHTDGFAPGAYVAGAKVLQVSGETETANNLLRSTTAITLNPQSTSILSQTGFMYLIYGIVGVAVIASLLGFFLFRKSRRPAQA